MILSLHSEKTEVADLYSAGHLPGNDLAALKFTCLSKPTALTNSAGIICSSPPTIDYMTVCDRPRLQFISA